MGIRQSRVGIKDVAALAGVSVGTVSHVLNNPEKVSLMRREAVLKAIKELGYVPNSAARQLKMGTSNTVAFVYPNPLNPFYPEIAYGVQIEAEEHGLVVVQDPTYSDYSREQRHIEIFEQRQVRGMIVIPVSDQIERLRQVRERGIPVVLITPQQMSSDFPMVTCDQFKGGQLLARHVLETGRKKLTLIGPSTRPEFIVRLAGMRSVLEDHPEVSLEFVETAEFSMAEGKQTAAELIERPKKERPDAMLFCTDLMALGALEELVMERKVKVPKDVAVIGYDDIAFARTAMVPLTTIRQSAEQMGRAAIEMLRKCCESDEPVTKQVIIEPELIVRKSS